eukprot:NODE_1292_length_462_cov_182.310448_g1282_i0.p3 GENE.NODE_1292_length_462_cov_182.310448_g1282_i0~~NODE_1292_length_462_cov_182.310448_g1282_i0.p3  ORF type:complete len:55 (+),score=0.03 NODE_1292_length_462_cov_182.310448_g1282_i0:105-269(+)
MHIFSTERRMQIISIQSKVIKCFRVAEWPTHGSRQFKCRSVNRLPVFLISMTQE